MKNRNLLLTATVFFGMIFGLTAQNVPSYVPTNGLVGWWPFNGNANDESGIGNNGTVNGATLTTDRFGNAGKAYSFDGVDDKISIAPSSSLNNFNNSITISAWIYSVGKGNPSYVNQDLQGIFGPATWLVNDGGFLFRLYDDVYDDVNQRVIHYGNGLPTLPVFSSQVVQTNSWENITCSYDGTRIRLYRNGIKTDSSNIGGGLTSSMNTGGRFYTIGQCIDWASTTVIQAFNGKLDDIAIYNRALAQQEIITLYQGASITTNCPTLPASLAQGLVGYWPFCGNANDESGKGNNGTVNGATLTADRFGDPGSAYQFNGIDNFIQLENNPTIDSLFDFSVSAWVKANSTSPQFQMIVSKDTLGDPPNGDWDLYLNFEKFKYAIVKGPNSNEAQSNYSISNSNWNFVTIVRSAINGKVELFINGILDTTFFGYTGIQKNKQKMVFGKQGSSNLHFLNGSLDDIAMWNRALAPQEITQLYNQGICKTSITVTDTLLIHTGITSFNPVAYGNTLKVWPNPGNTAITLDAGNLPLMQGWKIRISNSLGQEVYPATLISQQQQVLSMSTWGGNGLYLLHLVNPQGHITEVKKIVLAP
jgi:hypothetical protein